MKTQSPKKSPWINSIICLLFLSGSGVWGDTLTFKKEKGSTTAHKSLSGELEKMEGEAVYWQHPTIGSIEIDREAVQSVEIAQKEKKKKASPALLLTNGDVLKGEWISISQDQVIFKTLHGIEWVLPRSAVDRFRKENVITDLLYYGPKNEEEWTKSGPWDASSGQLLKEQNKWEYKERAWHFQGRLGEKASYDAGGWLEKKDKLPKGNFVFAFTVEFEKALDLMLTFGITLGGIFGEGYEKYFRFDREKEGGLPPQIDEACLAELKKGKVRFVLYYHENEGHVDIYANGKFFGRDQGKEIVEAIAMNRTVSFHAKQPCKLSHICVYRWDGKKEKKVSQLFEEKKQDQCILEDGRLVLGKIEGGRKGELLVQTHSEKVEIPLQQIKEIYFGNQGKDRSLASKKGQVHFHKGTQMHLSLKSIDREQVNGTFFGREVEIPRRAIEKIVWKGELNQEELDVLHLKEGGQLLGKLKAIQGRTISWSGGPLRKELFLPMKLAKEVRLAKYDGIQPSPKAYVHLHHGDVLLGEVREIDKDTLTIKTTYGGEMRLALGSVKAVGFSSGDNPFAFFEGFQEEEWKRYPLKESGVDEFGFVLGDEKEKWSYEGGSFSGKTNSLEALIKRTGDIKKMVIAFEVDWVKKFRLCLSLFMDGTKNLLQANRYVLNMQDWTTHLLHCQFDPKHPSLAVGKPFSSTGTGEIPELKAPPEGEMGHAKIKIFANREKGEFVFMIDGRIVQIWRVSQNIPQGEFMALHFFDEYAGYGFFGPNEEVVGKVGIRNFSISPWDGEISKIGKQQEGGSREHTVFLKNGDRFTGNLQNLKGEKLAFQAERISQSLEIDLEKVAKMTFAKKGGRERIEESQATTTLLLRDGGKITMELKELKKNKVSGISPFFGKGEIGLRAVDRIVFSSTLWFLIIVVVFAIAITSSLSTSPDLLLEE